MMDTFEKAFAATCGVVSAFGFMLLAGHLLHWLGLL